jgi:hypothetical protein
VAEVRNEYHAEDDEVEDQDTGVHGNSLTRLVSEVC